jgi:hypothetical protein
VALTPYGSPRRCREDGTECACVVTGGSGDAGTQRHMRAPAIVVTDPGFQDESQMGFGQWDQPVQALAADRADRALTNRVRLWTVWR